MDHGLEKLNDAVYRARIGDGRGRGPEIVFIHGLQVGENKNAFFETWLSEDGRDLWPKSWLSEAFPTAAIYLARYDSSTRKDENRGRLDMFATAEYLLQNLLVAKIGQSRKNPVILIGQDVGGLVIKEICVQASSGATSDSKEPIAQKKRLFLKQLKGVFYFSTPHGGLHFWDPGYQGELMKTLRVHNAAAARSNDAFRKLRMEYKWRAYGLGASLPGGQGQVEVKEGSARQDVDNFCMVDANATNICRLKDRTSTSFVLLENFIRETVSGFKNPYRVKLPFRADPHYVPLKQTVHGIRQRLESADNQVVVLCGDAGTGKTSLVKYLALQYELEEEIGPKSAFWDGIFYFECGPGTKAVTVLRKMLRELEENEEVISASWSDEDYMHFLLRKRLQNLNALIIIDDVWDDHRKSLVEKVVIRQAEEVKYVLTSQRSDVWRAYEICAIGDISLNMAQEIILKHVVGLGDEKIPEDDEGIVNDIIIATDFHPLALATISSSLTVDSRGRVPRADWEHLKQNLLSYLADEDPGSKPTVFGESYPRSVYAAMMNAVDLLYTKNDGCLHLLCIMALFVSPFPTSVLHMFTLCTTGPEVSRHVYRLTKRLQGRQLVQDAYEHRVYANTHLIFTASPGGLSITDLPCLKMHSLRQQFILSCGESDPNFRGSVEYIKGTITPFFGETSEAGAHSLESPERHFSPSALSTALCAVYGVDEVKKAALRKLRYPLKILVPDTLSFKPEDSTRHLETLMAEIENHSTSTTILSALQKVVWKYMFELQIDDDNVSSLISEGYDYALLFLTDYIASSRSVGKSAWEMTSSIPGFLVAAMNLLRKEVDSNVISRNVLGLLANVAGCIDGSYPASTIDAFDLEVLINVFHRVHSFEVSLPTTVLHIFVSLARIQSVKIRWMSLLRARPSLQKVIESFMEKLVANLIFKETASGTYFESEDGEYSRLKSFVIYSVTIQVVTVLKSMKFLCEIQTFGEEKVVTVVKSISKPLQAIVRLFLQNPERFPVTVVGIGTLQYIIQNEAEAVRSVIWSIPNVIEGMISTVRRPKVQRRSRPDITTLVLTILGTWIHSANDGRRSRLFSDARFLDELVEVIGDYTEEAHPEHVHAQLQSPHFRALQIIETLVSRDEAAASVVASLPKLHQVLSDLLMRHTEKLTRRYVLMVLLYLGYSIVETNDVEACSHLQVVPPERSHRAVVGFRAVSADNALGNLLDVICNKGEKVAREAGLDLLHFLVLNRPSARACIYSMPTAVTVLASLLHDDDVVVQGLAMATIAVLSDGFESDGHGAIRFTREIVLLPGVLESILKFTKDDWEYKGSAIRFVCRYLELEPEDSSHISAVRGIVPDMVLSSEKKHQSIYEISCNLSFLQRFSQQSKNLSFFLSIGGSVEAVVQLLSHGTYKLVEHQLVGSEKERMELVGIIEDCVCFLYQLAITSDGAMSRIVGTGRVSDLMLDLLDRKLQPAVQLLMSPLLKLSDLVGRSYDSVIQITKRLDFAEKFSLRLSRGDPEEGKAFAMKFPVLLACLRVGISKKITDLVVGAFQDFMDLLTNISEPQILELLESLLFLVQYCEASRAFVSRASGTLECLISLSIHHPEESARANALYILCLSYADVLHDEGFTPSLLTVLDALPEILSQLEGQEFAAVQVVKLLRLLAQTGGYHDSTSTRSFLRSRLTSLILYNSQVLQNLAGLLMRDEPEYLHENVMVVLWLTGNTTYPGMLRIVQIPGTLERIVELVYRGNDDALSFLQPLLLNGKFAPYAPRYLLKCLAHVVSTNLGGNDGFALSLLGVCALQNKVALRYMIDTLHKSVRYELRAKAMNYLINYVSGSSGPRGRTVLGRFQSLPCDLDRDDYFESFYDLQMRVLYVLDSLVKISLHNQLRIAKCVTGIYAHDLQIHMHRRELDAPNLKREGSMDAVCTEDLAWLDSDPDAEEILSALHSLV